MTVPRLLNAPPTLTNPITIRLPGGTYSGTTDNSGPGRPAESTANQYSLNANQDYIIDATSCGVAHNRGLSFTGGRNIVLIGGEWDINQPWVKPSLWTSGAQPAGNVAYYDDRNALSFGHQTGTVHVEGVSCHGSWIIDCIKWGLQAGNIQVQAAYLETLHSDLAGSGSSNGSALGGFHDDCLQSWGGHVRARFFWITGVTGYQGGMIKDDSCQPWSSNTTPPAPSANGNGYGDTQFHSLNYRYGVGPNVAHIWNLTQPAFGGGSLVGPMDVQNCWISEDPALSPSTALFSGATSAAPWNTVLATDSDSGRSQVTWPNWPAQFSKTMDRRGQLFFTAGSKLLKGVPKPTTLWPGNPTGDFVAPSDVGIHYVSPGYITDIVPLPPPARVGSSNTFAYFG